MARLTAFLDRLHLQEIKAVEQFVAGQTTYQLTNLLSSEVDKVLVSGEIVPFTRFQGAINLTAAATGPVIVVPNKRIDVFQLGPVDPVEIFIKVDPGFDYSSFSITSINTLDDTPGLWQFSLTRKGAQETTLLSDSVPGSLWVFPANVPSNISYNTVLEISAFASLRKK